MKSNLKVFSILAIIVFANITAKAQFSTGNTFVQGSLNINQPLKQDFIPQKRYGIGVDWGKYISPNVANIYSINVSLDLSKITNSPYENNTLNISFAKGKEYYKSIFGKFGVYGRVMGGVSYTRNYSSTPQSNGIISFSENMTNSVNLNLYGSGGLMYHVNDRFSVTANLLNASIASLGYSWGDSKQNLVGNGETVEGNFKQFNYNFRPNVSFSYGLGIRYIFK
jgi:hypothetical protein